MNVSFQKTKNDLVALVMQVNYVYGMWGTVYKRRFTRVKYALHDT